MALVEGIHILAHGDKAEARRIAMDIEAYQRLLIGTWSFYGAGVYAYYVATLPPRLREEPQLLFRVDETRIVDVRTRNGTSMGFFRIPGPIGSYVPITVIAFRHMW
jgi:hypothetical protein